MNERVVNFHDGGMDTRGMSDCGEGVSIRSSSLGDIWIPILYI